jgi:ClpA/ClpB-like protein
VSFQKTTPATRDAFIVGGYEALRFGHDHLGTEHFLLGVVWGSEITEEKWFETEDPNVTDEERLLNRSGGLAAAQALRRKSNPAGEALADLGVGVERLRPLVKKIGDRTPEEKRPSERSSRPLTKELGQALFQPDIDQLEPAHVLLKALSLPGSAATALVDELGLTVTQISEGLRLIRH